MSQNLLLEFPYSNKVIMLQFVVNFGQKLDFWYSVLFR